MKASQDQYWNNKDIPGSLYLAGHLSAEKYRLGEQLGLQPEYDVGYNLSRDLLQPRHDVGQQ